PCSKEAVPRSATGSAFGSWSRPSAFPPPPPAGPRPRRLTDCPPRLNALLGSETNPSTGRLGQKFAAHFEQGIKHLDGGLRLQVIGARPGFIAAQLKMPWRRQIAHVAMCERNHERIGGRAAALELQADLSECFART